jgi:endonuclease YncB( thermonuclease family)
MQDLDPVHVHAAQVLRIIDADTYEVSIDLDFFLTSTRSLRLAHVDAPEKNTEAGRAAISAVTSLLGKLPADVLVHTYKPQDKFGSYLADVFLGSVSLADSLLAAGLAYPYEGGTKRKPS